MTNDQDLVARLELYRAYLMEQSEREFASAKAYIGPDNFEVERLIARGGAYGLAGAKFYELFPELITKKMGD